MKVIRVKFARRYRGDDGFIEGDIEKNFKNQLENSIYHSEGMIGEDSWVALKFGQSLWLILYSKSSASVSVRDSNAITAELASFIAINGIEKFKICPDCIAGIGGIEIREPANKSVPRIYKRKSFPVSGEPENLQLSGSRSVEKRSETNNNGDKK